MEGGEAGVVINIQLTLILNQTASRVTWAEFPLDRGNSSEGPKWPQ